MMRTWICGALCSICVSILIPAASADVRLPAMFTDHAVLQRGMPVPVWGWSDPNEPVTVSFAGQSHSTTGDADGQWRVTLDGMQAGGPHTLVVEAKNRVEVNDVLVGEVWLCSGQSNMEWSVADAKDAELEIAAADHPQTVCFPEGDYLKGLGLLKR